jgi:predicted enzyme related to lactoylglutathione lyase
LEKLGGKTIMPVSEVPGGPTIAMFTGPAGNRVGLVKVESM